MRVAAQDIRFSAEDRAAIGADIDELLTAGRISSGPAVQRFEEAFSAYLGGSRCVAVSSGTTALELILQALGAAGRTVLVPANTNFATYIAARRAGAIVRLVDVDPATLSPSPQVIEQALSPDVAAVVLVHMGGLICPGIKEIAELCGRAGAHLVEDAAHAHGSRLGDQHAGTFGVAAAFSFFATKVLPTGEGGMVVTGDPELAEQVSRLRNLGKAEPWVSVHVAMGGNARMHEFAGVLGLHQLPRLDSYVARRRELTAFYLRALADNPAFQLVEPWHPVSGYKVVGYLADGFDRADVKRRVLHHGVQLAGEIYEIPLHRQPVLAAECPGDPLPGADYSCDRQLCLPIYPTLTEDQAATVVDVLLSVLAR
jgi:dTDP-4-amino-4,6-dideoxygalactose transaminase